LGIDVRRALQLVSRRSQCKSPRLRQTAYRILVGSSESALRAGSGDLWIRGACFSRLAQIVYAGSRSSPAPRLLEGASLDQRQGSE